MTVTAVEQRVVEFQGAEIMAIKADDGKVYAGVRWICDGLGLTEGQRKNQMTKILEDVVLRRGGRKMVLPTTGGQQEVLCISVDYLPLWLAKINANIISDPEVQERLVEYQLRAKDALANAFVTVQRPTSVQTVPPITHVEALLQAVQILHEHDKKLQRIEDNVTTISHRVDSLDTANIEGDLRQRFEKMVSRYAWAAAIKYPEAWKRFDQAYNTAFRANLTALRHNFAERHGLRSVTRPEYFERVGQLPDAIRIADKMLASVKREGA